MRSIPTILIWLLALIGLSGTLNLVQKEFTFGGICPKIAGIPACFIILACLLLIVVSQTGFLKDKSRLFFVGAGIAWLIAITGSTGQFLGLLECPKTAGGLPMCYISLAMFSGLLALKFILFAMARPRSITF